MRNYGILKELPILLFKYNEPPSRSRGGLLRCRVSRVLKVNRLDRRISRAVLLSSVLVAISAWILKSKFADYTDMVFIVGTFASIFSFYISAWQFTDALQARIADASQPLRNPRRVLSFSIFSFFSFFSAALFVVACVNFARLLKADLPTDAMSVLYKVIFPFLVPALFLILDFKVRAVRMLDMQKASLKEIGRALNSWPLEDLHSLPPAPVTSSQLRQSYHHLLDALCQRSLFAASLAGHQENRNVTGLTAVLFLADTKAQHFVPVAIAGGTPNYRNALERFRPPFFKVEEFRQKFNQVHRKLRKQPVSKRELPAILHQFRKGSKNCISTTGVVYAIERRLVFSKNLYDSCIAFRFEFLDQLPDERKLSFTSGR